MTHRPQHPPVIRHHMNLENHRLRHPPHPPEHPALLPMDIDDTPFPSGFPPAPLGGVVVCLEISQGAVVSRVVDLGEPLELEGFGVGYPGLARSLGLMVWGVLCFGGLVLLVVLVVMIFGFLVLVIRVVVGWKSGSREV